MLKKNINFFLKILINVCQVGPMARSVADAAILLGVISDIDLQGCDVDITSCLPNQVQFHCFQAL